MQETGWTGIHCIKQNKPMSEREESLIPLICGIQKKEQHENRRETSAEVEEDPREREEWGTKEDKSIL